MRVKRQAIYHYIPTEKWLRRRRPIGKKNLTKKEILEWYNREKKILAERLKGPVYVDFECYVVVVGRETKKPIKSKEPKTYRIDRWKLSRETYERYVVHLKEDLKQLKGEYNEQRRARRASGTSSSSKSGGVSKPK